MFHFLLYRDHTKHPRPVLLRDLCVVAIDVKPGCFLLDVVDNIRVPLFSNSKGSPYREEIGLELPRNLWNFSYKDMSALESISGGIPF